MAREVKSVKCKCGTRYRTKLKRGMHIKTCPECGKDNTPVDVQK